MEEEGDRSSSTTSSLISDLYDSDNDIDINHMDSVNEEEQDDKSGNSENQDRLSADLSKPFEEKEPERSKIHSNTINSNNDTPRIIALTPKPSKSTSPHGKGKQKSKGTQRAVHQKSRSSGQSRLPGELHFEVCLADDFVSW